MPTKFAVALLTVLCGCSTTATISRVNGTQLDAEIQRSDRDNLVVTTNTGHKLRVPRSEVSDIDHPGNVSAVIGSVLSVYGAVNIVGGMSTCVRVGGAFCAGMVAPAAIGVPMLIWGLKTWSGSTEAAGNFKPPAPDSVPSAPAASAFDVSPSTPGGKARASRRRVETGGLQNIRWGMSPEEVRGLYVDVEASRPDLLSTRRLLGGSQATVHFGFLGGQLTQISAELARSEAEGTPSDVFGHFKELLGHQYGQPLDQGEGSVTWSAGETTIKLLAPSEEGAPVKLVYERDDSVRTVRDEP
jgi:hypothetical protein